ncbi:MAG: ABC transporter permease subunit [Deltaproteobacteria bacterium]|nr:MAG: ABC transporter permease subunit [Deltaproteobacteria bacterium]
MTRWWLRPAVRVVAAIALPLLVPAIITALIWALPGDPASIICPPQSCGGTEVLAARWNLDAGPWSFFWGWLGGAVQGDFGNSWRLQQGVAVAELLREAVPNTLKLLGLAIIPVGLGSVAGARLRIPRGLDAVLQIVGLVPALVLSLVAAAAVTLAYGSAAYGAEANLVRLAAGALVLGLADGALSGAVLGTRDLFQTENKQRYVSVALLRGERRLPNTLPNVAPALAGQLRARLLHLLSGAVVVEVVLRIDGMGDLLWGGTLLQDFGVVLAAATCFSLISSFLLLLQAVVEIVTAWHVRRAPVLSATASTVEAAA